MAKEFDIIDLNDKKAAKFAEVMGNKTSKKIFNYLKKHKAGKADIAKSLGLPLSTVHYNLEKLHEAGLVKIHDYYWSPKGNKVQVYTISEKILVFTPKKSLQLEEYLKGTLVVALISIALLALFILPGQDQSISENLERFPSDKALIDALNSAQDGGRDQISTLSAEMASASGGTVASLSKDTSPDYSKTNIQVEGVDEADIIKTDGKYIYTITKGRLTIAEAYPQENAKILSQVELKNIQSAELFIQDDKILIIGSQGFNYGGIELLRATEELAVDPGFAPYSEKVNIFLYDVSDKENPEKIRSLEFEGNYIASRKIGDYAYFMINSYPKYLEKTADCEEIVPLYREDKKELEPIAKCTEVGYIQNVPIQNFITIASISMEDGDEEIQKEIILGAGQNVYASQENIYIVQGVWPSYGVLGTTVDEEGTQEYKEKTVITKFNLNNGKIEFGGSGEVEGHILNQFSMDEYEKHFRIATTTNQEKQSNNLFVLNEDLKVVGSITDIAPGESIFSARFMGKRAYMVTFRQVDPLFVLDLSDHKNPTILGKLKIPGYSNYLHPYDENHVIGIGKEVDASIDADKVHSQDAIYFTAIQGVKLSIFDVTDVSNPKELHKEIIGDRGTDSIALTNHKAFLFDKEKKLLVLPITLAELKSGQEKSEQGEFTFQGAYVYDIDLKDGFNLRGKVTHYKDNEAFIKSGYYYGPNDNSILRSLYIKDTLYTLSNNQLQLNNLKSLERIKVLNF